MTQRPEAPAAPPHGEWWALGQARRPPAAPRVPLRIDGEPVGSVEEPALPALAEVVAQRSRFPPGAGWRIDAGGVRFDAGRGNGLAAGGAIADAEFAAVNAALRDRGCVVAWRDEPVAVFDCAGRVRARIERASARFWGTLTLGAHATGWVAGADGRPASIWVARRSLTKATDPGAWDNLIGGGVPAGQNPWQALQREGWEEAGLDATRLASARAGRIIGVERPIAEGWQREWIHAFDLELPAGERPRNQDGEVDAFECLPVDHAMALAAGSTMTVDASLVTLDFGLRHGLLGDRQRRLEAAAARLWIARSRGGPADPRRPAD